jgi:cob(I)alamin adenosyltransferase
LPARDRGLVHIYTGRGKGKTTAALGLAMRAAGQGLRVVVVQFIKGNARCGEHLFLDRFPGFRIVQPGEVSAFRQSRAELAAGVSLSMEEARRLMAEEFDLVVLDEAVTAVGRGLLDAGALLGLIQDKPDHLELVLTGRDAHRELLEAADYVTEMLEIKHPYTKGERARRGIEY